MICNFYLLYYNNLLLELNDNDEYLVISDQEKWMDIDRDFFKNFIYERSKHSLDIKLILESSEHAKYYQGKEKQYNEKVKVLPNKVNFNINLIILPHKVIYVQIVDPISAIVIENPNVVAMNRSLFYLIWKLLL